MCIYILFTTTHYLYITEEIIIDKAEKPTTCSTIWEVIPARDSFKKLTTTHKARRRDFDSTIVMATTQRLACIKMRRLFTPAALSTLQIKQEYIKDLYKERER